MAINRFGSKPIHLFVFTRQHLTWRYCTADRNLEIGGKVYLSAQIERDEIKQTVERAKDRLSIRCAYLLDPDATDYPVTQPLGDNWWPYVSADVIGVTCLAYDAGTMVAPEVEWIGQVTQPKFGDVELELVCEPGNGYGRARGQGMRWQRGCGKTPYSVGLRGCNMAPADFAVTATVAAVGGLFVTAPELSGSAFALAGGFITYTAANGLLIRREIATHAQSDGLLVLTPGGAVPAAGDNITALPTCPRTWAACALRNNTIHYGGSVYKPVKNPMDGVSMSWS